MMTNPATATTSNSTSTFSQGSRAASAPGVGGPRKVVFDDFQLDLETGDLLHQGQPVHLAAQPAKALRLLVERAGELVLREEIQLRVWGDLVIEQDQGLNTCIRQIRTALGDVANAPRFIETVPRRGYRFLAPVRDRTASAPPTERHLKAMRRWGLRPSLVAVTVGALGVLVLPGVWRGASPWPSANAISPGATVLPEATYSEAVPGRVSGSKVAAAGLFSEATANPSVEPLAVSNPLAREALLRGRYLLDEVSPPELAKARIEFERALALDPGLAEAYVGLADVAHLQRRPGTLDDQRQALTTSLELDPSSPEALVRLGRIQLYADWDLATAGESLARAVELAPDNARARHVYSVYLSMLRRHDEALVHAERAWELDPIATTVDGDGAMIYFNSRRYERAVEVCRKTLDLAPDHLPARDCLLNAYRKLGRPRRALEQAVELMRLMGASEAERQEVATLSDTEEALRHFYTWQVACLEKHQSSPVAIAAAHLSLGNIDEVFVQLERAYEQHAAGLLHIAADPRADLFREDPRFIDLLERLGFPASTIER